MKWIIRLVGKGKYQFCVVQDVPLHANPRLAQIKVPDATPGVVAMYSLTDEQALLARVRYNRLIDIFTGVSSYSLQNHLRTTVSGMGQVETDEIYVGIDSCGAHHVFPVQAKGGKDKLHEVQIEQDFALCAEKFPGLTCLPIGAQFVNENLIALFGFQLEDSGVKIIREKHYRLVPYQEMTREELLAYQALPCD
ncbi:hypothetical protein QM565_12875 [Geitlerinema splendidum]|nr:hypothetical protein [Geitlerinema splendidum]